MYKLRANIFKEVNEHRSLSILLALILYMSHLFLVKMSEKVHFFSFYAPFLGRNLCL